VYCKRHILLVLLIISYFIISSFSSILLYSPPGSGYYYSGVVDITNNAVASPPGSTGCYNCTAGTYQPGVVGDVDTGSLCIKCPSATLSTAKYSGPRASHCSSTCPAGYGFVSAYSVFNANEMRACTACVAGYYNDGTSIPCKQWYF